MLGSGLAKLIIWVGIGGAALSLYNFFGPLIDWYPFHYQPVYPTGGYLVLVTVIAIAAFILVQTAFMLMPKPEGGKK